MKKILVYDPRPTAWNLHFLDALLNAQQADVPSLFEVVLVVSETCRIEGRKGLFVDQVPESQFRDGFQLELKYRYWRLLKKKVKTHQPDHVFLPDLSICGWVLNFQSLHVSVSGKLPFSIPEIKNTGKRWLETKKLGMLMKHNRMEYLILPNDDVSAKKLTQSFPEGTRFLGVPEPVLPLPVGRVPVPPMRGDRKVFLYYGEISRRYGIGLLVDTLLKMSPEELSGFTLMICGCPEDPGYWAHLQAKIKQRELPVDLDISVEAPSAEERFARFQLADVVLLPVLAPELSSRVPALAAQAKRPLIGPESGLLGRLIRDHGLGDTCSMKPKALKQAMLQACENPVPFDDVAAAEFVELCRPENFGRTALKALKAIKEREVERG